MRFPRLVIPSVLLLVFLFTGCSQLLNSDDTAPPRPGAAGNIGMLPAGTDSVQVYWVPASDDQTSPDNLLYRVYWSESPDISTFAEAGTHGTMILDWTADTSRATVTDLSPETEYYCNIFAKDGAGNIGSYLMRAVRTGDGTAPIPGASGAISAGNIRKTTLTLHWEGAMDNASPRSALQYQVVQSDSGDIGTIDEARTNGAVVQDWLTDATSADVTGLQQATAYYFNVLVKDETGNVSVYQSLGVSTFTPRIFWCEDRAILSANLDGTAQDTILSIATDNFESARDLAIDPEGGKLYWVDYFDYSNPIIKRANLDGSQVETVLSAADGLETPSHIALDLMHGMLYWIDPSDPTDQVIGRAKLDGSQASNFWHFYSGTLWDIAVDGAAEKIYLGSTYGIYSLSMDRLSHETVVDTNTTAIVQPAYLSLDLTHGKIYWAENGMDSQAHPDLRGLYRVNLDGTGVEKVQDLNTYLFTGLLVDPNRERLYWSTSTGSGTLMRGDLVASGPGFPLTRIDTIREGLNLVSPVLYDIDPRPAIAY